jgi:hypothetical protein
MAGVGKLMVFIGFAGLPCPENPEPSSRETIKQMPHSFCKTCVAKNYQQAHS